MTSKVRAYVVPFCLVHVIDLSELLNLIDRVAVSTWRRLMDLEGAGLAPLVLGGETDLCIN
ncbi:hypothetical protein CI610_03442 [invertebrate metagenome]|uniref:Uncharacterized protein n=1 Tax=invertebrate metagenome TaxID=1711999 RepID=A0A2H9T357_9ZZZZ